jgi:hypothetical protein
MSTGTRSGLSNGFAIISREQALGTHERQMAEMEQSVRGHRRISAAEYRSISPGTRQ